MHESIMATDVITIDHSTIEKDMEAPVSEKATSAGQSQSTAGRNNQQKKSHRRKPSKKKRKWKPYSKMSWEERKALEEKEKSKAYRIREEMKEKGRPVAPYNTTQFLMEEHDPFDSDTFETGYNNHSNMSATGTDEGESFSDDGAPKNEQDDRVNSHGKGSRRRVSVGEGPDGSMEDYTDSPHMVPEFISQDFSETYERVHEERLQNMTRDELVTEHMDLEKKLSVLQDQIARIKRSHENKVKLLETEVDDMQMIVDDLKSDNERLVKENEELKSNNRSSASPRQMEDTDSDAGGTNEFKNLCRGDSIDRR